LRAAGAQAAGWRPLTTPPAFVPFAVKPDLWYLLPVQLESSAGLGAVALPKPTRGAGGFTALLGMHGFVELPPGPADYAAGHVAPQHRR
jgi:hypothetical protein